MNKTSVTEIIRQFLRKKEGLSQAKLAEALGQSQQNFHAKIIKNDLDTDMVVRISQALKHDFLFDLSILNNLNLYHSPSESFNQSILQESGVLYNKAIEQKYYGALEDLREKQKEIDELRRKLESSDAKALSISR